MKFTKWSDISGDTFETVDTTWPEFVAWVRSLSPVPSKTDCQLISLSTFGDRRSVKFDGTPGGFRHQANVTGCYGAELDYDGETIPYEEAGQRLADAGIEALIYTSPSYEPSAPRWRVILPFHECMTPEARTEAVERVNGLFGGILNGESFTLSQPFYVGPVIGKQWKSATIEGGPVLGRADLARVPKRHKVTPGGQVVRVNESDLVENVLAGDEIHPSIRDLAWFYGWDQERLEDLLHKSTLREARPKRYQTALKSDIPRAVLSALQKRQDEMARKLADIPPPPRPLPTRRLLLSAGELEAMTGEPEWLVEGILEAGVSGMVFGQPGAGKSFVTIGWAASIAAGVEWQGRKTRKGLVVYAAGEGHRGLGRRIKAWRIHTGQEKPPQLHFTRRAVPFNDAAALGQLVEEVDALPEPPVLIVVDTLARAAPGLDLDRANEMGVFVRAADQLRERYGCSVLVVHHSGHGDLKRAMNSIAMKGAVDFEAGVLKEGDDKLRLISTKMKDGEEFDDLVLRFEPVKWMAGTPDEPKPQGSVVLVECEAVGKPKKYTPTHLELLREIVETAGEPIASKRAKEDFVRLHGGIPKTAQRAFYDALDRAIEEGLVNRDDTTGFLSRGFGK